MFQEKKWIGLYFCFQVFRAGNIQKGAMMFEKKKQISNVRILIKKKFRMALLLVISEWRCRGTVEMSGPSCWWWGRPKWKRNISGWVHFRFDFFKFSLFRTLSDEHGKVIEFDLETSGDIKGEFTFFLRKSQCQCYFSNYLFQHFISNYCFFRWQGCQSACCVGTVAWFKDYFNWWRSREASFCLFQIRRNAARLQKYLL